MFPFFKGKKEDEKNCERTDNTCALCGQRLNRSGTYLKNGKKICETCYQKTNLPVKEETISERLRRIRLEQEQQNTPSATDNHNKSNSVENKPQPETNRSVPVEEKIRKLELGTYSFSDAERQRIKNIAVKYLPEDLGNPTAQRQILNYLSSVMSLTVVEMKTELSWDICEKIPEAHRKDEFDSALAETILAVDQSMTFQKPDYLKKRVADASPEELLKAWIALDYYSYVLKQEYTANIRHFRDFIHNRLLEFENNNDESEPVKTQGTQIYIDSAELMKWKKNHPLNDSFTFNGAVALSEKEPSLILYDDGIQTRNYRLQTEGDEDYTGKYFMLCVRLFDFGKPAAPVAMIDGFISDTPEARAMTTKDTGYRMESYFLSCGGEVGKKYYEMIKGQDLVQKGLKYKGLTTPGNTRLVGICPECNRSFCFHGYAFYMAQSDVAYSDDGLYCCEIQAYDIDKEKWSYEIEGKVFRYYNSFKCPYCGTPYIDYQKYPGNKVFGVSGCVLLGEKYYQFKAE